MSVPDPSWAWRLGLHAMDLDPDGHVPALAVPYDNTASGIGAANVQDAIDLAVASITTGAGPFYNIVTIGGAVGDGTTDDTAAIIAAMDAADATGGGVIYFPPTSDYYKITTLITRTGTSSYHLLGGGARHAPARVHQATSNTGAFKFAPSSGTTNRDKTPLIENLAITGAGSASSGRGIEGANDLHVRDCLVAGFFDGIYLAGASYYSSIKDTTVTDCDNAGIRLVDTNNTTIDGCRITGNWGSASGLFGAMKYGIHINCGYPFGISNRIVNTSVEYYTDYGIYWNGGFACLLEATYQESQQSSSGFAHLFVGDTEYMNGMVIVAPYMQGDGTSGFYGMKFDKINGLTISGGYMGVNAPIGITSTGNSSNFLILNISKTGSPPWTLPASTIIIDPANPPDPVPAFDTPAILLGAVADDGVATTVIRSDATIVAFDDVDPVSQAFDDVPDPGSADLAARSDHRHGMPAAPTSGGRLLISSTPSNPIVFADVMLTSDGTDFVYSS